MHSLDVRGKSDMSGTNTPQPLVSIGMPVYNGSSYLRVAIDSLLAQTLDDFEIVISDNASEDDTQQICEEYVARDDRVKYSRVAENLGALPNFNRVWELSSGKYFKWASHDDWISPRYLEKCVEAMEADDGIALAYGQMCRIDGEDNTKVLVYAPAPIVRSTSMISRFHDSLWKLKFHPIFGVFRSDVFGETMGLTNNPEPDRILLAEVPIRGRFSQLPHITLFQRSSVRKSTWLWLSSGNRATPLANSARSVRALSQALSRYSSVSAVSKFAMMTDMLSWSSYSRVRGKWRQLQRKFHIGWGRGPTLDPKEVRAVIADLIEAEASAS